MPLEDGIIMVEIVATQVIQDFAIIMVVASVMALVSYRLKQPMVIGYIAAGMIIGPHTPPFSFILHPEILNLLAEIGIVLLLFVVGLEYPIAKLRSVGRKALVIAFSEAFGTFGLGFAVGQMMGLALFDSLFIALAISVTSTVVLSRVLQELGITKSDVSTLLLGITVIEDIIIVSTLAVLQSVASTGTLTIQEIAISVLLVLAFIAGALFIGSKTVPKIVDLVSKTNQVDVLIVAILGVAFGLSFIANQLGISAGSWCILCRCASSRIKKSSNCQSVNISPQRHVCSAFLRICWCLNGRFSAAIIHCSRLDFRGNFLCSKIHHGLSVFKISGLK